LPIEKLQKLMDDGNMAAYDGAEERRATLLGHDLREEVAIETWVREELSHHLHMPFFTGEV
jgi:hypothetical protein